LNAVLAVGERRLETEEIHHLRERQGDHREVDALAPDRHQSGNQPQQRRRRHAQRDRELGRHSPHLGCVRRHVAGHAEEHGVPEGEQTAEADQQIERAGKQRHAQHVHEKDRVHGERRHREERHHGDRCDRRRARLGRGGRAMPDGRRVRHGVNGRGRRDRPA
jgi:hypothetical protein